MERDVIYISFYVFNTSAFKKLNPTYDIRRHILLPEVRRLMTVSYIIC